MISLSADRRETPAARIAALQAHLSERESKIGLPEDPGELFSQIRRHLVDASDEGHLATKINEVFARVKLSDSPIGKSPEVQGIYGGEKDLKRTGEKPHIARRDGAWFVFTITVRRRRGQPLELVAYDFELCFPSQAVEGARFPRFIRFDLNQPGHDNESRGLRSHLHPGHDDLIVPAPIMSPLEILDLFVAGLLVSDHSRKA